MSKFEPGKKYKYKGYVFSSRTDTRYAEQDGHLQVGKYYTLLRVQGGMEQAILDVPGLGQWSVGIGCLALPSTLKTKNLPSWW
jgi:hypothetical protein